jgi:hypothetical protein
VITAFIGKCSPQRGQAGSETLGGGFITSSIVVGRLLSSAFSQGSRAGARAPSWTSRERRFLRQAKSLVGVGRRLLKSAITNLSYSCSGPNMRCQIAIVLASLLLTVNAAAAAQITRGQYEFASERACAASGKLTAEQCANAAANAQAEFDEKAPRFSTREVCERVFARAGCSVGFSGSGGWEGKKSDIYFTPRQQGFRVSIGRERDVSVTPFTLGPAMGFSRRSILRRDTRIDPHIARHAREIWSQRPASPSASGADLNGRFGVDMPTLGAKHDDLPPPPPVDPNFDCAAVLEPSSRNSADTGCYPAPPRRR